ncbi:hypothetical protein CVT24_000321 [Panaeolus cyanescens]|uniref:FAD/NAD(P)-binding domain-containing protein n=1 Tax=Panaeolus cyanescens TaxID=181874 RepID=A0A409YCZ4_9AGAR|nr:hypothetical protein CVT24_000321 [Panaeolus cyanescens]
MPTIHNIPDLPFPTLPTLSISPTAALLSPTHLTPSHTTSIAKDWLDAFSKAISCSSSSSANVDAENVLQLMMDDCWWRDMLPLTWDLRTFHGKTMIKRLLEDRVTSGVVKISNIRADEGVKFGEGEGGGWARLERPADDIIWITLFFKFDTDVGAASGIVRLMPNPAHPNVDGSDRSDFIWKAHTIYTNLESLHNHPEQIGPLRSFAPNHGKWESARIAELEFRDTLDPRIELNPEVLIIGAGHSGLDIAARLKAYGVKSLCVERNERIGDNWRGRYETLCLHDPVWYDHSPYLPFPPTWPVYTPARKFANWLQFYADALELNVWTSANVVTMNKNEQTGLWEVDVVRKKTLSSGEIIVEERTFRVKHVVVACGLGGAPNMPKYPGMDTFKGEILHSTEYKRASDHTGKKVVVVGACTAGHDIAADYQTHGIDVTLCQRGSSSTYIMTCRNAWNVIFKGVFCEPSPATPNSPAITPPPTDLGDRINASFPHFMATELNRRRAKEIAELDKDILDGLKKVGFKMNMGIHGTGFGLLAWTRAGGYYFDTGASQLIADGKIKLKSTSEISSFSPSGIIFEDGSTLDADVVVFATGIGSPREYLKTLLPPTLAPHITPLWGLDAEGELNGLYKQIGVEGLWSMVGSLGLSRFHSKHLALREWLAFFLFLGFC